MKTISLYRLSTFHEFGEVMTNPKNLIGCEDYYADHVHRFIDSYIAYMRNPKDMNLLTQGMSAFDALAPLVMNHRIEIECREGNQ
ncbi:hypothetical protein A3743_16305 [Oleiphilus sp. HI0072]|nr:hypothetical protein A3743_16305 [Oleiphilus sp. HI0072]